MKQLFKAVYVRYNDASAESVALRASLLHSLYCYEPPQGTDFPYGTFFLVSDIPWNRFVEKGEEIVIQFNLFSKKGEGTPDPATEISTLYGLLDAVYKECSLIIDDYIHVFIQREMGEILAPDESGIYQGILTYRILMEKS